MFQQLHYINPIVGRFTVEELLFGFSEVRRRAIPSIIIFMLLVMKHTIWVARCDFRFRQRMLVASKCLSQAITKLKFILGLLGKRCRSPAQIRVLSGSGSPAVLWGTLKVRNWSLPSECPFYSLFNPSVTLACHSVHGFSIMSLF